mgnify:CR=1 FL=1
MEIMHGTAVELGGKAVLIKGKSGSGKSSLALKLVILGANLVADDRVLVFLNNKKIFLKAPKTLPTGIEIRGLGILNAPICAQAPLALVVNLDETESQRFPDLSRKKIIIEGSSFPFLDFKGIRDQSSAIFALLKYGVVDL